MTDDRQKKLCEQTVEKAVQRDAVVRRLLDAMGEAGCPIDPKKFFSCVDCGMSTLGYYHPKDGIRLCTDRRTPASRMIETMRHELVHAYDRCARDFDQDRLDQLLCSEVRATRLSGDCTLANEWTRGHYSIDGQARRCIRRRAVLSLQNHNAYSDLDIDQTLDRVYDACYADTRPIGFAP